MVREKTRVQDFVLFQLKKKQSPRNLFFFSTISSPCLGLRLGLTPLKMMSSLTSVPEIFQHQGYGNSFRGAKGSQIWLKCGYYAGILFPKMRVRSIQNAGI
jgi:hypothetical protein